MVTLASCASDTAERSDLSAAALQLHVCLDVEPDHEGPCTDSALRSCAPQLSREACLARALDELAAVDELLVRRVEPVVRCTGAPGWITERSRNGGGDRPLPRTLGVAKTVSLSTECRYGRSNSRECAATGRRLAA